ncbi:hypothetical protein FMN63_09280 [Stappia sp. BW2]|uniref:hypothetical protein n=1 Tax=Stappia sp. BW2 TaxID=2592622 RepID=UPI0011DE873A|nr:hypothetical protein [Stappia sp. BW2]TYC70089.1 hypothetical protein FMN63_09280 [Stappia sp. BW2]
MSESTANTKAKGPSLEAAVIAVICVAVLLAGWYILSQRQQGLRRSPAGLDGLQVWLVKNGASAQNFAGGWLMDQTSVGLLVVPLYDTLPETDRSTPGTKEELLQQQDEYDLETAVIAAKAERVPTLLVLPKWRSGMRLTGLAHPALKVEANRLQTIVDKITGTRGTKIGASDRPFTDFRYRSQTGETLRAEIYAAQTFANESCRPIVGDTDAMLLADCPLADPEDDTAEQERILVLSDPDLINNHGLRLGENAGIALDVLTEKAGTRNIVIDYSRYSWLRDPVSEPRRERTWDDLLRFFGSPFRALWLGAALLLGLALWRGLIRYGPIRDEEAGPGNGKDLAVLARARLMRLSGQDGALVREYATARISATASALFGPAHARHYAGEDAFLTFTERRHPALAPRLRAILADIRKLPARLPATEAIQHIDQLEQVLEQITHDA